MKVSRVLIFGDSIGQGFYDEINGGWVQRLQRDYFAEDIAGKSEVNIINLSVSGHSSNELLDRIKFESGSRMKHDMLTVLAIGTNDTYERGGVRRTDETKFEQNIGEILKIAKSFGDVLMLGLAACVDARVQPTAWDQTLVYKNNLLQKYESILESTAKANSIDFIPLWKITNAAQQTEETLPDGIHPNARGHEVIYNEVKNKLKKLGI